MSTFPWVGSGAPEVCMVTSAKMTAMKETAFSR